MYKCRLVYDEWKAITKKKRFGVTENSDEFQGYVGVLSIDEISEKQIWQYKGRSFTVCDKGYQWLSILPENENYCITVMMDDKNDVCVSYIDMIEEQGVDEDGVPWILDCYLDLVVHSNGDVIVDDRDELDEALESGDITKEQHERMIQTSEKLMDGLLKNYDEYLAFVNRRLQAVNEPGSRDRAIYLTSMTPEMYHSYFKEYENDPDLWLDKTKYVPYEYSEERVDQYIKRQVDLKRKTLAIMRGEEIVGEVIIKNIEEKKCATLGICLKNASYKDRGIGTQAEKLAIDYVFHELDIPVLYADSIQANTRSQHVLEKVGFKYVNEDADFKYYQIDQGL